jgi:FMN-dependent oxidoreductase (nitrilotriacetate monooxygenase family)
MAAASKRLRFTYFSCFSPGGLQSPWNHPKAREFDYLDIDHWVSLAQALESAKFDAFFWADHVGVHDLYQGSYATSVRAATQYPVADPMLLTAALAASTTDLGFAFSANPLQEHPYGFARRLSTLDHLTRGRIAWNIVTSFQPSAWKNFGHSDILAHDARYEQAEEYVQVLYKLLEGSWEDGAVLKDVEQGVYADPDKVHAIGHQGEYYSVPGIHTNEPSPQRTPVLFQAGTSAKGRAFAGRNAEAIFIAPIDPTGAKKAIEEIRSEFVANGRHASDGLFFVSENVIVASTEDEAKRKKAELDEIRNPDFNLNILSSMLGFDLAVVDPDTPIRDLDSLTMQGQVKAFTDSATDKSLTVRNMADALTANMLTVGTPEQVADKFEVWRDAGADGINLASVLGWGDAFDFIEHVVPVLQERGLMQTEYSPGTLREKFFAGTESASGPRLNQRHQGTKYRRSAVLA